MLKKDFYKDKKIMNFKIILIVVIFLSSFFLYGCGRKDAPVKPSEVILKN